MEKARRGIQSVEIASALLVTLARHIQPMALRDLAKASGISATKAHPYMVTFLKVGFVIQDAASGYYELGPLALQLGLAKLQRLDPVKEASLHVAELAQETEQSVAIAVWGNLGPTIVRLEEPVHPLHVNLRTGTVMSLRETATGRLFAAFMPPKVVEKMLRAEASLQGVMPLLQSTTAQITQEQFDMLLNETRKYGLSRSLGIPIPGIDAFCAPVFDSAGNIVLGILVMGPTMTFDSAWDGPIAQATLRCAREISHRMGYSAE